MTAYDCSEMKFWAWVMVPAVELSGTRHALHGTVHLAVTREIQRYQAYDMPRWSPPGEWLDLAATASAVRSIVAVALTNQWRTIESIHVEPKAQCQHGFLIRFWIVIVTLPSIDQVAFGLLLNGESDATTIQVRYCYRILPYVTVLISVKRQDYQSSPIRCWRGSVISLHLTRSMLSEDGQPEWCRVRVCSFFSCSGTFREHLWVRLGTDAQVR